jgi:hypothetical protein
MIVVVKRGGGDRKGKRAPEGRCQYGGIGLGRDCIDGGSGVRCQIVLRGVRRAVGYVRYSKIRTTKLGALTS